MPRIYNSCSDPLDFCKKCFPTEAKAIAIYGNMGNGPDGRGNCFGYDEAHPDYDESEYNCDKCGKELTNKDN